MGILELLLAGSVILGARVMDVTIGTLRVIAVIDGRVKTAFALGFIEVTIWLAVISTTLAKVNEEPILAIFFALGFSMGNVVGILVERVLPLGNLSLRAVGGEEIRDLAGQIRDIGLGATVIRGEGRSGERLMLFSFMPKKELRAVQKLLTTLRERIFYTIDYGGSANRILLPRTAQPASPRRFFKRK